MIEEVKRAIDNNDISKLYACGFYSDSSIHEYILKNKKRNTYDVPFYFSSNLTLLSPNIF